MMSEILMTCRENDEISREKRYFGGQWTRLTAVCWKSSSAMLA